MGAAKRNKLYRPRAVGRPVMARMRDDLILPGYVALTSLQSGADQAELASARHTLAALLDYMLVALHASDRDTAPIRAGLDALLTVVARHARVGTYRCTGPELAALRAGVVHSDEQLPYLRTDQLTAALRKVDRVMVSIESRAQQPTGAPA